MSEKEQGRIYSESLQKIVGERFGRYSKYIIQDRALPDVRDGLKPVQRRILYAMHKEGNNSQKPFRKSAKTVGNVIGNYHPHGDTSVYDAMVRLSQDWKLALPLVQMHGNNGSIDGDSAAAMRYTEARLSQIAELLLVNIDKNTVDFIPNFDDTDAEPTVLPARYPNLLVNGSTGISAGYATDIPPHNLNEIIHATIHLIKHPKATLETLMEYVKGPDFPGGAIIQGMSGITDALKTGKGKIVIRSKVTKELVKGKTHLIITEIPYEVNKANLVRQMDEIRAARSIEGISEVRDESDRMGLRVVVELKKEANVEAIQNYFYKNTDLQINYNYNMVSIYHGRPMLMGLKAMLTAYIEHQVNVLTRRTQFDLKKALRRAHIVEGLIKALSILDQVIETIRGSVNRQNAVENLVEAFAFTLEQAESIVQLQLYRLTNTDVIALEKEAAALQENIQLWEALLVNEQKMRGQLITELTTIVSEQPTPRRSVIEDQVEQIVIEAEALIAKRSGIVSVTKDGYVKFTTQRSFLASQGAAHGHKSTDVLIAQYEVENNQTLISITSDGFFLFIPVHLIPEKKWKEVGVHMSTIVQYNSTAKIIYSFGIQEFVPQQYELILASQKGMIKKIDIADLHLQRFSKASKIMKLAGDDQLIAAHKIACPEAKNILLVTKGGLANYFAKGEIPLAGVKAQGVKAIKLSAEDQVCLMLVGDDAASIILFTQHATFKRLALSKLEYTGRYKKGFRVMRVLKSQAYEIIGGCPYRSRCVLVDQSQPQLFDVSNINLSDLSTVGKKIEGYDQLQEVYYLSQETIATDVVIHTADVVSDLDKTSDELVRTLQEQGVLFDE